MLYCVYRCVKRQTSTTTAASILIQYFFWKVVTRTSSALITSMEQHGGTTLRYYTAPTMRSHYTHPIHTLDQLYSRLRSIRILLIGISEIDQDFSPDKSLL